MECRKKDNRIRKQERITSADTRKYHDLPLGGIPGAFVGESNNQIGSYSFRSKPLEETI